MNGSGHVERVRRRLQDAAGALARSELVHRIGSVRSLRGRSVEADGPPSRVGELCVLLPPGMPLPDVPASLLAQALDAPREVPRGARAPLLAEVVAVQHGRVTLMPYGDMNGLGAGGHVVALGALSHVAVGPALLGRVIDGMGRPLDGLGEPRTSDTAPLRAEPVNPMQRPRIGRVLETGIRSIDAMLTLGQGQRMGIFAGSGVGKSTLLGMIARHVSADVNVIALIGERGREVREFIDKQLGPEGLRRSVVVVATADQPAPARIRAAYAALAIAEYFRHQGSQVLLTMDSITRLAMARREVGLAAGEPPTARGYTPSVFAELPELCERCGTAPSGGSITALLTVLVEGDDFNEPVADALRAILDGHIVLSRQLAHQGQYPAIDVLRSASRLLPDLATAADRDCIQEAVRVLSLLDRNAAMVELGAYERGGNPELDRALGTQAALRKWLHQAEGGVPRAQAVEQLRASLQAAPPAPAPGRADRVAGPETKATPRRPG